MIARLKKRMRYGAVVFEEGREGIVVDGKDIPNPFKFYDLFVQFDNHEPVGLFKEDVEVRDGQQN